MNDILERLMVYIIVCRSDKKVYKIPHKMIIATCLAHYYTKLKSYKEHIVVVP